MSEYGCVHDALRDLGSSELDLTGGSVEWPVEAAGNRTLVCSKYSICSLTPEQEPFYSPHWPETHSLQNPD